MAFELLVQPESIALPTVEPSPLVMASTVSFIKRACGVSEPASPTTAENELLANIVRRKSSSYSLPKLLPASRQGNPTATSISRMSESTMTSSATS